MRDFSSWSLNLGKWHGVHVRLHAFFLLFGVCTLYLMTAKALGLTDDPGQGMFYGLMLLGILFLSVLAHEVAHCLAAFRVGGGGDQIVIWPFGGLSQPHVPHEYQHELITAVAGPLVNLVICLLVAPLVWMLQQDLWGLLKPLDPHALFEGSAWLVSLKLTLWLNWMLVLVNLLPAFPLDGGRVLRSILWRWFDYRTAVLVVTWGAKFIAAGLCVMAWLKWSESPSLDPSWVALLLLAMFLFFSAKQEMARLDEQEMDEELFSYDFSQGYTSLDRHFESPRPSGGNPLRRWLADRQRVRHQKQQLVEQEEERRVDEILAQLHETGMDRLSAKDRALLQRVSARYRNRQQS
jgi:Zn-dependent protease